MAVGLVTLFDIEVWRGRFVMSGINADKSVFYSFALGDFPWALLTKSS